MRRYVGKYASGTRKADEQLKRERDWIKAQPLAVRRSLKAEVSALAALNAAVSDGSDRDTVIGLRRAYDDARVKTSQLIKEHRNA